MLLAAALVALAPAVADPPAPRGLGLLIAAGATGHLLIVKGLMTMFDAELARELDHHGSIDCIDACGVGGWIVNPFIAPGLVTSIGLFGGGMRARGLSKAELHRGRGGDHRERARAAAGLGFTFIGVGAAYFVAFQVAAADPRRTHYDAYMLREVGWWTSIAAGYAGAGLAGWGTGYLRGRRPPKVSIGPTPGGFTIRGRF